MITGHGMACSFHLGQQYSCIMRNIMILNISLQLGIYRVEYTFLIPAVWTVGGHFWVSLARIDYVREYVYRAALVTCIISRIGIDAVQRTSSTPYGVHGNPFSRELDWKLCWRAPDTITGAQAPGCSTVPFCAGMTAYLCISVTSQEPKCRIALRYSALHR